MHRRRVVHAHKRRQLLTAVWQGVGIGAASMGREATHRAITPIPVQVVEMFALEPGQLGPNLQRLGASLPDLAAIVIVSPHWQTRGVRVSGADAPATIHDFGGFPAPLYALQYPVRGAPQLASEIRELLLTAGFDAAIDDNRGLDHGAWVPLRYIKPQADVPVLQVSLPHAIDAAGALRLGKALAPLREQGVLVIGPGQHAWFRVSFTAAGPQIVAGEAEHSRAALVHFIKQLQAAYAISAARSLVAGFSQGGILSASVGLSAPETVRGFAVLAGRILPELEPRIAAPVNRLAGMHALIAHGRDDDKLPLAWAERADAWLTRLEVPHELRLYPGGHGIGSAMATDFQSWATALLPSGSAITPA